MKRKNNVEDARLSPENLARMVATGQVNAGIKVTEQMYVSPLVLATLADNDAAASYLLEHGADVSYSQVYTGRQASFSGMIFHLQAFALAHLDTLASKFKQRLKFQLWKRSKLPKELIDLIFSFEQSFRQSFQNFF